MEPGLGPGITYPSLFEAADQISDSSQRTFLVARGAEFALLVISAGFGEIPRDSLGDAGSWIALVSFTAALVIRVSALADQAEKRWYDARAAAESVKSAAWQFAVGGGAFPLSDNAAEERFLDQLKLFLSVLRNLNLPAGQGSHLAVTNEMKTIRSASRQERSAYYLTGRVKEQLSWYSAKADTCRKKAALWRFAVIAVDVAAVALALLRVIGLFDVNWLGVLATAAAGIAAWQQTKNYSSLSEAYAVTSQELAIVNETVGKAGPDEASWARAVHDSEAAFSREHTLWLARRVGPVREI